MPRYSIDHVKYLQIVMKLTYVTASRITAIGHEGRAGQLGDKL